MPPLCGSRIFRRNGHHFGICAEVCPPRRCGGRSENRTHGRTWRTRSHVAAFTQVDSPKEATAVPGPALKGGQGKAAYAKRLSIDPSDQFFTYFLMSFWSSDAA